MRTTYEGLLERTPHERPFVLTRAFFFGSQKYGAYWTGDSRDGFTELSNAVSMLLSAGISGLPFGGADIPSFVGNNTEHTWVVGY
jgi:alpha 1,3-glucosidase